MRPLFAFLCVALLCFPSVVLCQEEKKVKPPEITKIQVGFQSYQKEEPSLFKVGLWTPINVEVFGGSNGIAPSPNSPPPYLSIETEDSEDVGTRIRVPILVEPNEVRNFTGYVKTGHMGTNDIRVTLNVNNVEFGQRNVETYRPVLINEPLYVTIGPRADVLSQAVRKLGQRPDDKENFNNNFNNSNIRRVAFENDVKRLPKVWFGYNSVDLLVLSTANRTFLNDLRTDDDRIKALAQWVRRGGRLVIPVAWQNQDALVALLQKETAWQPPIPVVPPRSTGDPEKNTVNRLAKVEDWGNVREEPFRRLDPQNPEKILPIPVARLDPDKIAPGDWEVLAESSDGKAKPLIAQVRYGLGQITYLAFSLDDPYFLAWNGKEKFLQTLATKLAPRVSDQNQMNRSNPSDLSNDLLAQLDNFDVTVIPFGYVALFIILYILVVGPLDFFLLKYVFKRLEWTWITFPTVVVGVSIIAYFAAYALKGRDLKINKVDLVDFDMRTSLDGNRSPKQVHAYGQSFFTILSPRIQNYTVGLEPNPAFWGEKGEQVQLGDKKADRVLSVDLLSWMGRASGGFHDMGRSGSSGFFRKPYTFREDASALEGVPIPVWTTKAFSASWEQKLTKSPFKVNLTYHIEPVQGKEIKISGTLENHLGVDLVDAWLIYFDRCYPIQGGLKKVKDGEAPPPISIAGGHTSRELQNWVRESSEESPEPRAWSSNPASVIKQICFHEWSEPAGSSRNHLLRPLDLSWHIQRDPLKQRDDHTREAILFARVRFVSGWAETVTTEQTLPTKLWLGDVPETGKKRPELIGHLNQDTFIRVLLPLQPAKE